MKKLIFQILLLLITNCLCVAQTDQQVMEQRCREKIKQMCDYHELMIAENKSLEYRNRIKDKALKLFIGDGYQYTENNVTKEGVMMQTSTLRNGVVRKHNPKLTRNYYTSLINLKERVYSKITFITSELSDIRVSNLRSVGDGKYVCVCEFVQIFVGESDGRVKYKDKTVKRIECHVELIVTGPRNEYIVRLGDTEVSQTSAI